MADRSEPRVGIEIAPPPEIAVGGGNAFTLGGYCYQSGQRTIGLAVRVGGTVQPVERFGLPRDDVYAGLAAGDPAAAQAYRSGFVALVDLGR